MTLPARSMLLLIHHSYLRYAVVRTKGLPSVKGPSFSKVPTSHKCHSYEFVTSKFIPERSLWKIRWTYNDVPFIILIHPAGMFDRQGEKGEQRNCFGFVKDLAHSRASQLLIIGNCVWRTLFHGNVFCCCCVIGVHNAYEFLLNYVKEVLFCNQIVRCGDWNHSFQNIMKR